MNKYVVTILKFAISFAILGFLFYQASNTGEFAKLATSQKDWWRLGLALVVGLLAVSVSFFRWYLLVRALELPMNLMDALRLGFIGYLFTFLTLGVLGGDTVKAVFVARQTPDHKTEAVTTVFIDRVLGLFGLFLLTSIAYFYMKIPAGETETSWDVIRGACKASIAMTIAALVALIILLLNPRLDQTKLFHKLYLTPKVGPILKRGVGALMTYRKRMDVLIVSAGLSVAVHALLTVCVFLVASGISESYLPLRDHFVMVPIANVIGAIPLPGGLGAFEAALNFMYVGMSNGEIASGKGFIVAFGFRLITLVIASVGVVLYISHKKQVSELLDEASADDGIEIE